MEDYQAELRVLQELANKKRREQVAEKDFKEREARLAAMRKEIEATKEAARKVRLELESPGRDNFSDEKQEEQEAKEKKAREKKERDASDKKKRETEAKAAQEAKEQSRKDEQVIKIMQDPLTSPLKHHAPLSAVPISSTFHPTQTASNYAPPHLQITMPVVPKAPMPVSPRQTSFQGLREFLPKPLQAPESSVDLPSLPIAAEAPTNDHGDPWACPDDVEWRDQDESSQSDVEWIDRENSPDDDNWLWADTDKDAHDEPKGGSGSTVDNMQGQTDQSLTQDGQQDQQKAEELAIYMFKAHTIHNHCCKFCQYNAPSKYQVDHHVARMHTKYSL